MTAITGPHCGQYSCSLTPASGFLEYHETRATQRISSAAHPPLLGAVDILGFCPQGAYRLGGQAVPVGDRSREPYKAGVIGWSDLKISGQSLQSKWEQGRGPGAREHDQCSLRGAGRLS